MEPKPRHLQADYAAQFQDTSIVAAYHHRPPYPDKVFDILVGLLPATGRAVLDAGCGTGDIARPLAPRVERLDAVDWSRPMIERGRELPNGDHPCLTWIEGRVEEAPLRPPYGLITAGESLHWFDWTAVFPRFRQVLAPEGALALIGRVEGAAPWTAELRVLQGRYSTNRDFQPYNLVAELERRGLFAKQGERRSAPVAIVQTMAEYVESIHSRNGFSRDRMDPTQAAAFDAAVAELLRLYAAGGRVTIHITGLVTWGYPLAGR